MKERVINALVWLIVFTAAAIFLGLSSLPMWAQEQHYHSTYHESFYSKWERPNGLGSCCHDKDCHPIDDRDIRPTGDKLEVRLGNRWIDVPKELIRPYAPPDMQSHICNAGITIYCFVFGGGT